MYTYIERVWWCFSRNWTSPAATKLPQTWQQLDTSRRRSEGWTPRLYGSSSLHASSMQHLSATSVNDGYYSDEWMMYWWLNRMMNSELNSDFGFSEKLFTGNRLVCIFHQIHGVLNMNNCLNQSMENIYQQYGNNMGGFHGHGGTPFSWFLWWKIHL